MAEEEQEITAPYEAGTLQAGWAARAAALPRCHAELVFGAKTDLGRVRENNEDKFDFLDPADPAVLAAKGRVFAVADGMGGHSAGQVAAELALNVFIRSYYADTSPDIETCLQRAVREANAFVVETASSVVGRRGMGATLTAAVIRDDDLFLAQVGDSRCYLYRAGRLEQLTEDHSWVAEQVRAGAMTPEQAEQSPFRNVITRSMGGSAVVEPDVTAVRLQAGDRYLLCSDGLCGVVPDEEIGQLLRDAPPSAAAWNLVDRANEYGGKDNITVIVLEVREILPWPGSDESQAEAALNGHAAPAAPAPEPPPASAAPPEAPPPGPAAPKGNFLGRLFGRS